MGKRRPPKIPMANLSLGPCASPFVPLSSHRAKQDALASGSDASTRSPSPSARSSGSWGGVVGSAPSTRSSSRHPSPHYHDIAEPMLSARERQEVPTRSIPPPHLRPALPQ